MNGVSLFHHTESLHDLEKLLPAEEPYICVGFEPVNNLSKAAKFVYLCLPFGFIVEQTKCSTDMNPAQLLQLFTELIKNNNFIVNHLKLEYAAYSLGIGNAKLQKAYCLRWLSKITYDLLTYFSELVADKHLTQLAQSEKASVIKLEQDLSSRLGLTTPKVKEMAISLNMSVSKFKTIFKEIFYESPHQYFLNKKLAVALELLSKKELSLSEIAYRVGFSHPSGLTRLIKSKLGETPTTLLQTNTEED
jgi:AraC-like DNA-binding protein